MEFYRHGDVILKPVNKAEGKEISRGLEFTAALGEATGHHHTFYASPGAEIVAYQGFNEERYAEIVGEVVLKHQEHGPIKVKPGSYEIIIKREYDYAEEEIRNVVD